jgi:hypothetical protein
MQSISSFNIDLTNDLGKSPLQLAVENAHLEVVISKIKKKTFNPIILGC